MNRTSVPFYNFHDRLRTLLLFCGYRLRGAHSYNLQDAGLIFGAVVVDLFRVMRHVTARRNGCSVFHIVLRTGLDPPGSLDYIDVTVILMKMRTAIMMWQPLLQNDIQARLVGIAQ